jgi:hypothetical protein
MRRVTRNGKLSSLVTRAGYLGRKPFNSDPENFFDSGAGIPGLVRSGE